MSEVKPQEAFHTQTGEDAYGNDMWGSKGVNPDYVTFLEDSWNTRPSPKAQIAEDVFLHLAHSHSQMLQTLHDHFHPSTVKHAKIEQDIASYMQENGLMEKYFAVCENEGGGE